MIIKCDFSACDKLQSMLTHKYPYGDAYVGKERNCCSSLDNLLIYMNGRLLLRLCASSSGYITEYVAKDLPLEFIGDICECLAEKPEPVVFYDKGRNSFNM